ncbi:MAG: GLPGLI family protein [Prevotellaceae bacterium]|jgi:GLPGLI family protein|nr:GLPGLI family protein [Prevotellaceae bacterium]
MKRIYLILLVSILSLQCLSAQGLRVVYEDVSNISKGRDVSKDFESVENPEVRAFLENKAKSPTVYTSELLVNKGVSLYARKVQPKKEEPVSLGNEQTAATIRPVRQVYGTSAIYKDYIDSIIVTQMDVGDKTYLLESPLPRQSRKWEISSEQATILGYTCIKATSTFGEAKKIGNIETKPQNIVAWYCPDIPIDAGPDIYSGLPGLILKLEVNDGVRVYNGISIEPLETEIQKLEEGEKVNSEEFLAILAGYNAKNRENVKQQGGKVIVIQR